MLCLWALGWTILIYLAGQIMGEFIISGTRLRWTYERHHR